MEDEINWNKFTKAAIIGWCVIGAIAILKWIGVFSFTFTVGL